jgi:hypothetical protein
MLARGESAVRAAAHAQALERDFDTAVAKIDELKSELAIASFDADVPIRELREELDRRRAKFNDICNELGVPGSATPAPVANAYWVARQETP